jgi:predicted PurR-regulated permease PerM
VNINQEIKLPLYVKAAIFIVGLFVLFKMLYIAQGIIVPFIFAIIISIVLHPVVKYIAGFNINRVVAIIITLFLTFIVIVALGSLIFSQAVRFGESLTGLIDKYTAMLNQSITDASNYFEIDPQRIHDWITKAKEELIAKNTALIAKTLVNVGSVLVVLLLVPVYIFMLLFYQPLLLDFIGKLFKKDHQSQVSEIVTQTKTVIQRYLV